MFQIYSWVLFGFRNKKIGGSLIYFGSSVSIYCRDVVHQWISLETTQFVQITPVVVREFHLFVTANLCLHLTDRRHTGFMYMPTISSDDQHFI